MPETPQENFESPNENPNVNGSNPVDPTAQVHSPEPVAPEHAKTHDQLYLERLQFDPQLRKTWLNFFVSNFRVVILLIILLTAGGLYAFFSLPRESNPEVKIPIAVVTTVFPGASPADIEELVTKKVETQIAGLQGLDTVTSTSANSVSSVVVQFNANADLTESIRNLRDKINDAKPNLPTDATTPVVTQISLDDQPVLQFAITGHYDGFTLFKYAQSLKDKLETIPGVREVQISGGDEKEYMVAYHPDKLLYYNLSPMAANQAIAATNVAIPSGTFDSNTYQYSVRSDSKVTSVQDISAIPVKTAANGGIVTIGDIADVSIHALKKSTESSLSINGSMPQGAVNLSVIKRTGASVLDTVQQAKDGVDATIKNLGSGISYKITFDDAQQIATSYDQLLHDFLLTLLLVFAILFAIVGLKEAFVAGLAIPLVFFSTFIVLLIRGDTLNFLSLFSLILALGLLVDDAIVVVSATKQYLRTGKFTPEQAVLLVLRDFKVVLTTTTLTTVWAFLPLIFSTGIIGQYIKSIPVTVSITLISSLLIALMINHPLAAVLERIRLTKLFFHIWEGLLIVFIAIGIITAGIVGYAIAVAALVILLLMLRWYERGGKQKLMFNSELSSREWQDDELIKQKLRTQGNRDLHESFGQRLIHGVLHFDVFLPVYEKYLRRVISTKKSRRWTIVLVFLLFIFSVALPAFGIVKTEFFPVSDSDYAYVDITAPTGYTLNATNNITNKIEQKLLKYNQIDNFTAIIGAVSPIQQSRGGAASNVASIDITLKPAAVRKIKSYDFADLLRKDLGTSIDNASISIATLSGGPPSGAAFQAQISGDDLSRLDTIALELKNKLVAIPGVINAEISLRDASPQYTFKLDPVKLAHYNLDSTYVGSVLRMAIAGIKVSTVIEGNNEIKINAYFAPDSIPDLNSLQKLQIVNAQGQPVFLQDVATIQLVPSVESITRINQKRTVLLTSNVTTQTNSNLVLAAFQKATKDYQLPSGYAISYGGQNDQNQKSVTSVIQAMFIAILLIVATLIVQFNSFRKAFIVLVTIPLALIGVFIGMAAFGVYLSFPGLIGILALFGIVVKNAIILVDKMNLNLRSGIGFQDSIIDAGKSRLEAIFITSICTIFGILPVTLSDATWTALGSAVIFGLMLSSFLTLFIIPTLFVMLVPEKRLAQAGE